MWFEYVNNSIVAHLDEGETVDEAQTLEALAYSIDITFGDILNEGYPVNFGNAYAVYEFSAYVGGLEYAYSIGRLDIDELNNSGVVTLDPRYRIAYACADCADIYNVEAGPMLEADGGGYVCPVCGCHTSYPLVDACYLVEMEA